MVLLVAIVDKPIIDLNGDLGLRGVALQVNARQGCRQGGVEFFCLNKALGMECNSSMDVSTTANPCRLGGLGSTRFSDCLLKASNPDYDWGGLELVDCS